MISQPQHSRLGFTLIELLVVIAIIAVLIGLLLPAVQKVREAAARMKCSNNLKQLGLGLHQFHNSHEYFPPYGVFDGTGQPAHSWSVYVLPYIEQENLHRLYQFDRPWDDPLNQPATSVDLSMFICPSAPGGRENISGNQRYGLTDYSANFGLDQILQTEYLSPWNGDPRGAWDASHGGGTPRGIRILDIRDGTSSTVHLVEIAGRPQLWVSGRNTGQTTAVGGWATFDNNSLPIDIDGANPDGSTPGPCPINCQNAHEIYGFHTRGVNFLFADGSVRFVREEIPISIMCALITRNGGEVIPDSY